MARIEVPMPQMGESIAEGTILKWLKQLGDAVERDEPILEISTDKVDAEIPAPASGTLVEISVEEGETVEVGTVVAFIDSDGAEPVATAQAAVAAPAATTPAAKASAPAATVPEARAPTAPVSEALASAAPVGEASAPAPPAATTGSARSDGVKSAENRLRTRSTPVVRKIADEQGVDIASVPGTGHAGRVTKRDILSFLESRAGVVSGSARCSYTSSSRGFWLCGSRFRRASFRSGIGSRRHRSAFRSVGSVLRRGRASRVPRPRGRPGRADGQDP